MKHIFLPNNGTIIDVSNIICSTDYDLNYSICCSLNDYLNKSKNKINDYLDKWEHFKKYTNTYEFIHTQIPSLKNSVGKYKPLSRSYFKMIEIINYFSLFSKSNKPIQTFHLAEGPGGFIEAVAY